MAPKQKIPAPIDRPLSRAYLREFTGWSTAYPPGVSDPTSLRVMENVQINRDGSVRVRPGLRYLSYATPPVDADDTTTPGVAVDSRLVGTHEAFYLNDGTKAYLFAVREDDETVGFRVLVLASDGAIVRRLADTGVEFELPQGEAALNFTAETTYVKYLQIDNKIFALSNAGETMRMFSVSDSKWAKTLGPVTRPGWNVDDKLAVVHPDAAWVNNGTLTGQRTNLVPNPSFETNLSYWGTANTAVRDGSVAVPGAGSVSMRENTEPTLTNLHPSPLYSVATTGLGGWWASTRSDGIWVEGSYLHLSSNNSIAAGADFYAGSNNWRATPGQAYYVSLDLGFVDDVKRWGVLVRFYGSNGAQVGSDWQPMYDNSFSVGRKSTGPVTAPAGAVWGRLYLVGRSNGNAGYVRFRNIRVSKYGEGTSMFSGSSGAGYYWTGAVNNSASVYQPAATLDAWTSTMPVVGGESYVASASFRSASTARTCQVRITWYNSAGSVLGANTSAGVADAAGSWVRESVVATAPSGATTARISLYVLAVGRGEYHYVDAVQFEQAAALGAYFDGGTADTTDTKYDWSGTAHNTVSTEKIYTSASSVPAAETPTAATLVANTAAANVYNFGFFYTFANEVGESAASQISVIRTQRPWSSWRWETPNTNGEPSGTNTSDPTLVADQLVASMPAEVFEVAQAEGAVAWHLYMLTWSDQDPIPVAALRIATTPITASSTHAAAGWARATPQMSSAGETLAPLPTLANRYNYSDPSRGGQGLVAADRMVLVNDPTAAAVIRWTSNQQGEYTNFTAAKGGGYKTLTSGNLFVPACVKLWQNPQSVDTLTVLCQGTDGHSTGYYMAPAQVASQSEATNIMGFEETTATPGTTSPYGCEVANNALYHPLDTELVKSTASNYNINHSSLTDLIRNRWAGLQAKHHIVSSFHDNRLYYLVHNPNGGPLADGCRGNELWVLDISKEGGNSWSRWLVQGVSLRKIEFGGRTYMSVVRPDGIYYLDPRYDRDDVVDPDTLEVTAEFIPWRLETNTQGANRAHDAWCHLQQANVVVGNFLGHLRYGIRGRDLHGRAVEVAKVIHDDGTDSLLTGDTWDLEDYLLIQADLKEWFFFAESVPEELPAWTTNSGYTDGERVTDGGAAFVCIGPVGIGGLPPAEDPGHWGGLDPWPVQRSTGQISLVQYRYTPVSVNVGYEYGSVETFEYGRAGNAMADRTTDNGVPMPYLDTGRP